LGKGARKEFCCDAAYEGWGCTCAEERFQMEQERRMNEREIELERRAKMEFDGRYEVGKLVKDESFPLDRARYGTGEIVSISEDRKSVEVMWHESKEITTIVFGDHETIIGVLYTETEVESGLPEEEKFSIYYEEVSEDYDDYFDDD
jgi:hypothetical protein